MIAPALQAAASPACRTVLQTLEAAGHEAWLVGGCVRDALMGRPCKDVDIATSARWQQVRDCCQAAGFAVHETGTAHGTVTVIAQGNIFEVTTYRSDGTYSDARHPDSVAFVDSVRSDLARRDFTVNAMAYHPDRGLCDPFGGQADIANRTLRAVGQPRERFAEDALRILRGVRFSSQLGFAIEAQTDHAMRDSAGLLQRIAQERIAAELEGMLLGDHVHDALMAYVDIVGQVLPELLAMKGFDQQSRYHIYDVLEHTAYVVQYSPSTPLARWAALFHDIAKPEVFFVGEDGYGHFYGHPKRSVPIAKACMKRLRLPQALAHDVCLLVRYHDTEFPNTDKHVKRMLQKLDGRPDLFRALCELKWADSLAHAPQHRSGMDFARQHLETLDHVLAEGQAFKLADLEVSGRDVIAAGVEPGPRVGQVLNTLLEAVVDGALSNDRQALLARIRQLARDVPPT